MRESIRPGGRSARVQVAVHAAVQELSLEYGRDELTIPQIAERAGVTPSTIYRRWGTLAELMADVALEAMRPETPPQDTGTLAGDLLAWAEHYMEELSSRPGRAMIRDALGSGSDNSSSRCSAIIADQLQILHDRARERGERCPTIDRMIDLVVAPIVFHVLFDDRDMGDAYCAKLIKRLLS